VFAAGQSAEGKELIVLESSFCYWLVMWVRRWEASHL